MSSFRTCWTKSTILRYWKDVWQQGKTKHLNYGNVSRTSKTLVQKVWNIKILEGCQATGKNKTLKLWKCVPYFKTLSAKSVESCGLTNI